MRTTKSITETNEIEITEDIICNKCGNSCFNADEDKRYNFGAEGLLECVVDGGYYSNHLGDLTSYRFSMCEVCLIELFKTFRVPVEIKNDWHGFTPDPNYVPYPPPITSSPLTEEEIQLLRECDGYEE